MMAFWTIYELRPIGSASGIDSMDEYPDTNIADLSSDVEQFQAFNHAATASMVEYHGWLHETGTINCNKPTAAWLESASATVLAEGLTPRIMSHTKGYFGAGPSYNARAEWQALAALGHARALHDNGLVVLYAGIGK